MPTTTRDRTDDLHALEELWTSPAYGENAAHPRRVPLVPARIGGWVAFFAVAMAFQPAPEPGMTWPVWATAVSVSRSCCCSVPPRSGRSSRLGFAGAALAGPLGIALAVNCRAAEHHPGTGGWSSWKASPSRGLRSSGLRSA